MRKEKQKYRKCPDLEGAFLTSYTLHIIYHIFCYIIPHTPSFKHISPYIYIAHLASYILHLTSYILGHKCDKSSSYIIHHASYPPIHSDRFSKTFKNTNITLYYILYYIYIVLRILIKVETLPLN